MPSQPQYGKYREKIIRENTLWNYHHPEQRKIYNRNWRNRHYDEAILRSRNKFRDSQVQTIDTAENNYTRWGSDEETYLSELAPKYTIIETAIELGRTYSSINNKSHELGINFKKPSKFLDEKI